MYIYGVVDPRIGNPDLRIRILEEATYIIYGSGRIWIRILPRFFWEHLKKLRCPIGSTRYHDKH